jgi:hypothetical protein
MSDHDSAPTREYTPQDYAWLANAYMLKAYEHLKVLRETRDERHTSMAQACYRQAAQLYLIAAIRFVDQPVVPPAGKLPSVDDLLPQLQGRLRYEAEAALRVAASALTRHYWRDFAEALRHRFERAEPALFQDRVMLPPDADASQQLS